MRGRALLALAAVALALAACGRSDGAGPLPPDDRIDPALLSVLDDQIMTDPTLGQYSNRNAVRPPELPASAAYPPAPAPVAACGGALDHDPAWAGRLPAAFSIPAGARVTDAAGKAGAGCRVRVAIFLAPRPPAALLDLYWRRATRHGYSATQIARGPDQLLFGALGESSYLLLVRPAEGGAEVGLVFRSGG